MRSSFQEHAGRHAAQLECTARSGQSPIAPPGGVSEATADQDPSSPMLRERYADQLRAIIHARAQRFNYFPRELFADPSWDILLELALAEHEQRRISVYQLYEKTRVPPSTAARWIKALADNGLISRRDCHLDGRMKYIELSRSGSEKMRSFLMRTSAPPSH